MKVNISDLELKMWKKEMMPENLKGADGKFQKDENGKFIKSGKEVEYTTYTFRDLTGEVLEIMSAKNDLREQEGKTGLVVLNLTRRSFQGKTETKVSLDGFFPNKKA